jgi:hypothetical protein
MLESKERNRKSVGSKQILIDFRTPVPTFKFGSEILGRNVSIARTRMASAWRIFLRGGRSDYDPKNDAEERRRILAETQKLEQEQREKARKQYLLQKAVDNGKAIPPDLKELEDEKLPNDDNKTNEVTNAARERTESASTGSQSGSGTTEDSEPAVVGASQGAKF